MYAVFVKKKYVYTFAFIWFVLMVPFFLRGRDWILMEQ